MMRFDHATRRLRSEAGFTFVELCLVMTLSTVILIGILGVFDSFTSNAARQTRITDANDQVRKAMDRIVSDVRQAQTIEVAGPNDLVYTVGDSATAYRRERICLDASSRLWRSSVTTATAPAVPIASGTPCPTTGSGAFQVTRLRSANSASNPLFTYDSAAAGDVRSVGLTFSIDAGNHGRTDVSTLRASSFVRAQSETALPVDGDDIQTTCSDSGIPTLTLSAGVGPLNVSYTDIDGNALGASAAGGAVVLPNGTTNVVANITAASGAISQLLKTLSC